MKFDFIEIGTSDFDTLISKATDEIGISIEPVKIYFDNLPNRKNVLKLNYAIGDTDSIDYLYWVSLDDIILYDLPIWIKGCGKIFEPHPLVLNVLNARGLNHIYKRTECKIISWDTLIESYNIEAIEYLKIDTEGCEYKILNSLLNSQNKIYPNKIQFEDKDFTNQKELDSIISKFKLLGYTLSNIDYFDFLLTKNNF